MSKKKKQAWEIVIKDRFLSNEKPDNPYVTALLYFVVFFLSFLLIFVCFFQLCEVRGSSMEVTLENGDHVLLLKNSNSYSRGDIVVITKKIENENGQEVDTNIIKRVIAVEGDTLRFEIVIEDGVEYVDLYLKEKGRDNFVLQHEDYINERMVKNNCFNSDFEFSTDMEVPENCVFVMGDNRNKSNDSRNESGNVNKYYPISSIYGKKVLTIPKDSVLEYLLKLLYRENNSAYDG